MVLKMFQIDKNRFKKGDFYIKSGLGAVVFRP